MSTFSPPRSPTAAVLLMQMTSDGASSCSCGKQRREKTRILKQATAPLHSTPSRSRCVLSWPLSYKIGIRWDLMETNLASFERLSCCCPNLGCEPQGFLPDPRGALALLLAERVEFLQVRMPWKWHKASRKVCTECREMCTRKLLGSLASLCSVLQCICINVWREQRCVCHGSVKILLTR